MISSPFRSMLGTVFVMMLFAGKIYAETFEFLTYTPPRNWTRTAIQDGIAYQRPNGIGLIALYTSYPTTGSASNEFAAVWRKRVGSTVSGTPPQPQLQRDGEFTTAVGIQRVSTKDAVMSVSLVVIVGHGRALGMLAMSTGDDVFREVTDFFDSVKTAPGKQAGANTDSTGSGEIAVDFDVPPGYTRERDGQMVVLRPTTVSEATPCFYAIGPARPSSGSLETDAKKAITEPLQGWQVKGDNYGLVRGIGDGGWPYFAVRTDLQQLSGGTYQYLSARAMAFPSANGRVNIVWGIGPISHCTGEEVPFARLFHSLRPRGVVSDGGQALARELQGTWQNSQRHGLGRFKFLPGGRYESGIATSSRLGIYESRYSSVTDGKWKLNGSELVLTPDRRDRETERFRVRIFENKIGETWWRMMFMLDESKTPPLDVRYEGIEN